MIIYIYKILRTEGGLCHGFTKKGEIATLPYT